ncbi:MAG: ABC transporter ATP-binding protein [Pseudomonadota bacterium]
METSLYRYILKHSANGQVVLIILSLLSLPVIYITLDLPKRIINMLEGEDALSEVMGIAMPSDPVTYLMLLSFAFLFAVLLNGVIKYVINVYSGVLGERLLRRFRYELYVRILRFPMPHFKRVSQGELIPMITAETEPLAEFIGESFKLPVLQGGMLFTYLLFIFQQDVWLGAAAISLYPFQLYVIPKLQNRVNMLAKERVKMVRSLSGRIGETVSGINEVHTNSTSQFERAHISHRLGIIYEIRYAIYRRKFFIKFLNNFIAQLTPFFFYSVGGYFVLRGDLSIGSMVAVLVAYKDLAGPWKELLRYYQRKEDIKVKYSQVVEQFNPPELLDHGIIDAQPESLALPGETVRGNSVSYTEDGLYFSVDGANFNIELKHHIAAVGLGNSGKDELARLLTRLINPSKGSILLDDADLSDLPEALIGARMAYAGANAYLFTGSVSDNLLYPLKQTPLDNAEPEINPEREATRRQAEISGNSTASIEQNWVDFNRIGIEDDRSFRTRVHTTLETVELDEEVYQFGLLSQVSQSDNVDLARRVMQARQRLRDLLQQKEYSKLVEPFDHEKFNSNLSLGENLLFGTVYDERIDPERLAENSAIRRVLDETGLTDDLLVAGQKIAEIMLDLFADVEPGSELFEQFSFISGDDLPEFQQVLVRTRDLPAQQFDQNDSSLLLSLPFKLIPTRHRLGLIDKDMENRILDARRRVHAAVEAETLGIEFFDESQYNPRISIQDNILFGKLAYGQANAQQKINNLISDVIVDLGLRPDIVDAGLNYEVGVGGARLTAVQRQKLGMARSLIKSPDFLIVNEALAILDTASEKRIISRVRELMQGKGVFWVLSRVRLSEMFDSVIVLERGKLLAHGSFTSLSENNETLQTLLEQD